MKNVQVVKSTHEVTQSFAARAANAPIGKSYTVHNILGSMPVRPEFILFVWLLSDTFKFKCSTH